jgi:hypothetical protein
MPRGHLTAPGNALGMLSPGPENGTKFAFFGVRQRFQGGS